MQGDEEIGGEGCGVCGDIDIRWSWSLVKDGHSRSSKHSSSSNVGMTRFK